MIYSGVFLPVNRRQPGLPFSGQAIPNIHTRTTNKGLLRGTHPGRHTGANYMGRRSLKGVVLDFNGNPLAQARVTTWPRTQEVVADEKGQFGFDRAKILHQHGYYARLDGYASSLSPVMGNT